MAAYPLPVTGTFEEQLSWDYIRRTMLMAGLGFWQLSVRDDGRLDFSVNDNFLIMTGYDKESFPRDFDEFQEMLIHPDDKALSASVTKTSFSTDGSRHEMELRIKSRAESKWRWHKIFGEVAERRPDGTPRLMFGCAIDIHDNHEAGEKLAASESALKTEHKRLAAIIEAAGLVVWDWDLESETVRYGDALTFTGEDGFGRPLNISDHWGTAISKEDQAKVLEARRRHLSGGNPWYESEILIKRPNSDEVFMGLDRGRAVEWDKNGRPLRMMGVTINITDTKKDRQALDENRKKLEQMVEAANIAVWDWDATSDTIGFNNIYTKIMGRSRTELEELKTKWFDYIHPDDHELMRQTIESLVEGLKESASIEYRLLNSKGDYIWFYGLFRAMEHDDFGRATRIVGAQLDFTEKKKMEESQAHYLTLICRQKEAFEKQANDRAVILDQIKEQIEDLLKTPGSRMDAAQRELRHEILKLQQRISAKGELNGVFHRYLTLAFRFIANERVWYRAILDSLPFPTSVFDLNRNWTYLNPSAAEVIGGLEASDYIGRHYREVWSNFQDSGLAFSPDESSKKTFIRHLPDTGRYYACQSSILTDEISRSVGFIETMQDVTGAYEAETRMRLMMDSMPLVCLVFDQHHALIDSNREAAVICGYSDKDEFISSFRRMMPPLLPDGRDPSKALMLCLRQAFKKGQASMPEMMLRDKKGTDIPCEVYMTRVQWLNDQIVLAYFRDLRPLLAAQNKLNHERLLLKDILNGSPVPFYITHGNKVMFTTPFAYRVLGLNIGDRSEKIYEDLENINQIRRDVSEGRPINWRPVKFKQRDGQSGDGLLNAYSGIFEGKKAIMAWLMDISELKKKEKELKEALDLAKESTRAKSNFLANISHEIRTPMNAVIGMTHLLLTTDLNDEQRQYAGKADAAAKSLLHLINDILDFSKIEAGKLNLNDNNFNLTDIIRRTLDIFAHQASESGLELLVDIAPDVPVNLIGDDLRLTQIINNLASNAIKFTADGWVSLAVEVAEENDRAIMLKFLMRDSGIGIEAEKTDRIFSAFTQADESTTRRYGGTGLGLAISQKLVNMFGGDIWCESALGQGSLFGFTAWLKKDGPSKKFIEPPAALKGRFALVIDDNAHTLAVMKKYLTALGLETIAARTPDEAGAMMEGAHPIDVIVLDGDKEDGAPNQSLVARVKQEAWADGRPVIVTTSSLAGFMRQENPRNSADASGELIKPVFPDVLAEALLCVLDGGENCYNISAASAGPPDNPADLVKHLAGARILLVEDNAVNQLVARKILKKAQLSVTVANNGREAIDLVAAEAPFDLVLMDIQMPVMDGLEATFELRRTYDAGALPIVAMTAHAMPQDREKSLAAGMNDHLVKPLDVTDLFSCLAKWIKSDKGEAGSGLAGPTH